jgi:hypothetical protein
VMLRLRLIAAGLMTLWDDGNDTRALLTAAAECITQVCACEPLLADAPGESLYRTAMMLVDRVGTIRDVQIRHAVPGAQGAMSSIRLSQWFRQETQRELLRAKMPRFIAVRLAQDLAVKNLYLTTGGYVSHPVSAQAAASVQGDGHVTSDAVMPGTDDGGTVRPQTVQFSPCDDVLFFLLPEYVCVYACAFIFIFDHVSCLLVGRRLSS